VKRLAAFLVAALLSGAPAPALPDAEQAERSAAAAAPEIPLPDRIEFLPASAIRPGMTGVARTVFEGDRVEEFGVEFLGVLKNAIGPQQDMILARLTGDKVEYTGVVAGMSGSPVYVDGKLVGAVSYRIGSFAKEPIAGITPIGEMVKLAGPKASDAKPSRAALGDLLGWLQRGADRSAPPLTPAGLAANVAGLPGLQPIGTPLVCTGCDPEVLRHYAPIFEVMGMSPGAGGGALAATDPARPVNLVPGTAIGGALTTGDLTLVGIGTLTHVDGDRVFGFGHPMLGLGGVQVPMTQAQVVLTFASEAASFKIANATAPIGTIVEDRLTAIVGEVGRVPPTLPFKVRVQTGVASREFRFNVLRDRSWAPVLVALTTANSLVRSTEFEASATLALRYRIEVEGYPPVRYESLYSGTNPVQPVHTVVASDAGGLLGLLYNNPFVDPPIRSAEADIEVLDSARVASLISLSASRTEVRPGEPFRVDAVLQPFRGALRTVSFDVALPEDTPSGDLQIIVAGGSTMDGLDRRVRERQLQQAADLKDIIRLVGRQRLTQAIYLRAARRAPSAIVRSELLPELPLSVFNVFNSPRLNADATLLIEAPVVEISRDLDVVATGARRVTLKVK
jgi:hypothetical protein